MLRFIALLLLPLLCVLPARAQEDLLTKVIAAHTKIQNASVDALVDVVGEVDFKGHQEGTLWLARPKFLAWKSVATLPSEKLVVQIVADGENLWVYNSGEPVPGARNVYLKRPFNLDVMKLTTPEMSVGMGLHTIVLKLIAGDRENVLSGKQLRIPNPEPDAQGECMLELVNGEDVDQLYVDAKTLQIKRMVAIVDGKPMARAALTYKLAPPDPAVFKFTPPAGASPAPGQ